MNEIWKDIEGYEGYYQVSNLGRVKSLERFVEHRNGHKRISERLLSLRMTKYGYVELRLSKHGKLKHLFAHRLVAIAFIPNPDNKPQVNHKNGIKDDNRLENLEWSTASENTLHAHKNGLVLKRRGEKNSLCKLTEVQVIEIKKRFKNCYRGLGIELAKEYNIHISTISAIKRGKIWTHIKV